MEFKKYRKDNFLTSPEDYERAADIKFKSAALLKKKAKVSKNVRKKEMFAKEAEAIFHDAFMMQYTAEFLKEMENSEI